MGNHATWREPIGSRDAVATLHGPRYGWIVISAPTGRSGARLAVLPVFDWAHAQRTMPYRWLNNLPEQLCSVEQTAALAGKAWSDRLERWRTA